MALPTLDKTWQFAVNSASLTSYAAILYELKAALTGFASSPWTVERSSNGVVANDSDNWLDSGDVIWASGAHSWIVLKQTGVLSNFQILIETRRNPGGGGTDFNIYASPSAGFTGGAWSTSVPPTATDQVDMDAGNSIAVSNYVTPARLHVMQSTDGACTRWVVNVSSLTPHFIAIDKPKSPFAGWTDTWCAVVAVQWYNSGATRDEPVYAYLNDSASYTFGKIGSDVVNFYLSSEMYGSGMVGQNITVPDDQTGEWPMAPVGLACATVGHRGVRKGTLYDLWWASTGTSTGDTYPGDASNQFAQFGDIILPWDGSGAPLIA